MICLREIGRDRDALRIPHHDQRVFCIAFSPDGRLLAAGDFRGEVLVADARTGAVVHRVRPRDEVVVFRLAFSPDGRRLALVDREKARVLDMDTGEELVAPRIAGRRSSDVGFNPAACWSPDGLRLATTTWDAGSAVWDGSEPAASPASRAAEARGRRFAWHLSSAEAAAAADLAPAATFHLDRIRLAEPPDVPSRLRRAALLMRTGDPKAAADDYARSFESPEPDDGAGWLGWARAALASGDAAGYRLLRARLLASMSPGLRRPRTWRLARALALGPDPAADPAAMVELAEAVPTTGRDAARGLSTRALALHRAGLWDAAIASALASVAADAAEAQVCWPLLADAHRRLGHPDEASAWLDKSSRRLEEMDRRLLDSPDLVLIPDEWRDFRIFYAEAIAAASPDP